MVLCGWLLLRFSNNQVEKRPLICLRQLKQAIGHWWIITTYAGGSNNRPDDIWCHRRQLFIQAALRRSGKLRPAELAAEFQVSNRSAALWLKWFVEDGTFSPPPEGKRANVYALTHYSTD
jgi:hypothetical protein